MHTYLYQGYEILISVYLLFNWTYYYLLQVVLGSSLCLGMLIMLHYLSLQLIEANMLCYVIPPIKTMPVMPTEIIS